MKTGKTNKYGADKNTIASGKRMTINGILIRSSSTENSYRDYRGVTNLGTLKGLGLVGRGTKGLMPQRGSSNLRYFSISAC
jgi:hypothetical protein